MGPAEKGCEIAGKRIHEKPAIFHLEFGQVSFFEARKSGVQKSNTSLWHSVGKLEPFEFVISETVCQRDIFQFSHNSHVSQGRIVFLLDRDGEKWVPPKKQVTYPVAATNDSM